MIMKKLFYVILPIVVLMVSSCGQKKNEKSAQIQYDTIPATQITNAMEYYFEGNFSYLADAAVLKESSTGVNLPVVIDGAFLDAEKAYTDLKSGGKPVFGQFRGILKQKGAEEEGNDNQLFITQFIDFNPQAKSGDKLLTGEYQAVDQALSLNSDHTYKLMAKDGETESGKWYLSAEDVLVFVSGDRHTLMNVDYDKKELRAKDDTPLVFKRR